MDKQEKETISRYGKLVWDFANGKTTDEILISFFENLQSAFKFSANFKTKALKRFPTKHMTIETLTINEKELVKILLRRDTILKSCNDSFVDFVRIDKYDPINSMFTITERIIFDVVDNTPNIPEDTEETFLIPANDIDEFINSRDIKHNIMASFGTKINTLIKLCIQIEEIKAASRASRFAEIAKKYEIYPVISRLHDYLNVTQQNLKLILSQIIKSNNAFKSSAFKSILARYNKINKKECIVNNKHQLILCGPFTEDYFLKDLRFTNWQILFNGPISYCLVEFLNNQEYSGKERISICNLCNCFFCKSRLNKQQIFCPVCSRKNKMTSEQMATYMRDYRAHPSRRRILAKRKRESKII